MPDRPRVLVACPEFALPKILRILGPHVHMIHAASLAEAQGTLGGDNGFAMVLCGVYFDESHMYELLTYVRATRPSLPFVCCRILDTELPRIAVTAIQTAAIAEGAKAFVDLPGLLKSDAATAEERFKQLVLAHLPPKGNSGTLTTNAI